jgi:hypothetical protein
VAEEPAALGHRRSSWIAWNLLLNETEAHGFDVDAPVVMASWQDAGSGVLAFVVVALALTVYEPKALARQTTSPSNESEI